MADGFLGRWSRRKLDVKEGRPLEAEPVAKAPVPATTDVPAGAGTPMPRVPATPPESPPQSPAAPAPPEPPPTMADVQALTADSDFSRFTDSQVAPEVKNAAMKKLFADPHFNVMDGLDIYIDDYGKPDPMPESMLRNLASAQFLGLFRENPKAVDAPGEAATSGDPLRQDPPQIVAQSGPPEPEPTNDPAPDADPDLRLQQDPAPGPQGPRGGAQ